MPRPLIFFVISAILSIITLFFKSEPRYDYILVVPVGLYFIAATILAWKPQVENGKIMAYVALALLLWLVLFTASYTVLFFVVTPIAGGVGAWLMILLCNRYIQVEFTSKKEIIIAGIAGAVLGILYMVISKNLPEEIFNWGLKSGVIVASWQLLVGWQMVKRKLEVETELAEIE